MVGIKGFLLLGALQYCKLVKLWDSTVEDADYSKIAFFIPNFLARSHAGYEGTMSDHPIAPHL